MLHVCLSRAVAVFFFNDTATTEIYTLSLHDALPIFHDFLAGMALEPVREKGRGRSRARQRRHQLSDRRPAVRGQPSDLRPPRRDRKSTRLNSSHLVISYAVFCLKKTAVLCECIDILP